MSNRVTGHIANDWLRGLQTRADQPPLRAREPLFAANSDAAFGTIEPALAQDRKSVVRERVCT